MTEIIGIDHIYLSVTDLDKSESFYDRVFPILGFRKNVFTIAGDPHVQYFNRLFGFVLRPAKALRTHDPYSPGLHHFCLRVDSADNVHEAARELKLAGITVSEPKLYAEYAHDYVAVFLADPDGMRLEITNYRQERRNRNEQWNELGRS